MQEKSLAKELQSYAEAGILQEDVQSGLIYGTTYVRKEGHIGKGILLVHGNSGNRFGLAILANRLAKAGYFCLSIDLPSHYKNPNPLEIGIISETIIEAVVYLKEHYKLEHVGIVGHSLGAIGALFAGAGYTTNIEKELVAQLEKMRDYLVQKEKILQSDLGELLKKEKEEFEELDKSLDHTYQQIKKILFDAMQQSITMRLNVRCYVMLAPPRNIKKAYPAINVLQKLPKKAVKSIVEFAFHKPAVKQIMKEGNVVQYKPEQDPAYVNMQFFKTKEIFEFLRYISKVDEPGDFLSLLDYLAAIKRKEQKTNMIQYYYDKYIGQAPKLIIYGKYDLLLRPFMPFEQTKLEKMYRCCGNAEIIYGNYSHIMLDKPTQQMSSVAVRNEDVIYRITVFLEKHLRHAR